MPGELEGALAIARAALDAHEFKTARDALAPYLDVPTRRVATLMAEIEESEHGDEGRVREWMARAMRSVGDPAWTADGVVSERWLPVAPSGRLDGFVWKVPLAEIGISRPAIEVAAPLMPAETAIEIATVEEKTPAAPEAAAEQKRQAQPQAITQPAEAPDRPSVKDKPAEPVIPLVHAPDDPGPDAGFEGDPAPQPTAPTRRATWSRIKQLFR
jgi:HemY protein